MILMDQIKHTDKLSSQLHNILYTHNMYPDKSYGVFRGIFLRFCLPALLSSADPPM